MDSTREPFEPQTHSFLVRLWLEKTTTQDGEAVWRGHITHVASGTRHYVKHPSKIVAVIATYLYPADSTMSWRDRIEQWLTCTWLSLTGRNRHL